MARQKEERKAPSKDVIDYMLRHYGLCAECSEPLNGYYEADHIEPLWSGGTNAPENFQPLCSNCHAIKTKEDAAFRAQIKSIAGDTGGAKRRREGKSKFKNSDKKIESKNEFNSKGFQRSDSGFTSNNKLTSRGFSDSGESKW